eukprot:6319915-Pyramimonas_sp.AAC.1
MGQRRADSCAPARYSAVEPRCLPTPEFGFILMNLTCELRALAWYLGMDGRGRRWASSLAHVHLAMRIAAHVRSAGAWVVASVIVKMLGDVGYDR